MKRKLLFGMMLVLALILVGCGSKDEDSDERGLQNNGSATEDDSAKEPNKGNKPDSDKDKDTDKDTDKEHKDPIKDIVEDKADPFSITVGGTKFLLNAEEGIVGFGSMQGVGSLIRNGLETTVHAPKIENGIRSKEEYDSPDDVLCNLWGNIGYFAAWFATPPGAIKCDNGYVLKGRDYSETKFNFDYQSRACAFTTLFMHDFEYMGITPKSTKADLEKAGFYCSFMKDDYTNIFSEDDYSFEEAKKEYEQLAEQEVSHAQVMKSSMDDPVFPTQGGYLMALASTGSDFLKFDTGISKRAEEHYSPNNSMTEDAYAKTRILALWLGKKLMLLDEGKIDYIIIANAYPSDGEMNKENSAVLRLTLITRDDLMKKWPEKWGWEPQE